MLKYHYEDAEIQKIEDLDFHDDPKLNRAIAANLINTLRENNVYPISSFRIHAEEYAGKYEGNTNPTPDMYSIEDEFYSDDRSLQAVPEFKSLANNYSSTPIKTRSTGDNNYICQCVDAVFNRQTILFSIDMEAWEHNSEEITEIGIAIYDPRDQQLSVVPTINQAHIRIEESLHRRNGKYVPDKAENFNGPETFVMQRREAVAFVEQMIRYHFCHAQDSAALVGHDVRNDIDMLKKMGVNLPVFNTIIDTQKLFTISNGKDGLNLAATLRAVQIPFSNLHNAGNDAYYTLLAAMKMSDPQARKILGLDHPQFRRKFVERHGEGVGLKRNRNAKKTPFIRADSSDAMGLMLYEYV